MPGRLFLFAAMIAFFGISNSPADNLPVRTVGMEVEYPVDSGMRANPDSEFSVLFAEEISAPQAAWLRLYFGEVQLGGRSFVCLTSLLDGEQQALDASGLKIWSGSSAYFNGDRVLLELVVAPREQARVTLARIALEAHAVAPEDWQSQRGAPGVCGICNADDRTPSSQDWACRLMPVGCSATVYTSQSCLISAGHCAQQGLIAEFRVPASLPDCSVVHPPVADQFPVLGFDAQNAGLGADWSVMTTGPNNLGQTAFERYGQLRRIAPAVASAGDAVEIRAYGMDDVCARNRTQQLSPGAVVSRAASYYTFNADVHIGSSGGGVVHDGRVIAVVTHCGPNCPNAGTRVDQFSFVAGRNNRCPACLADVNGDRAVELADLAEILSGFGLAYPDPAFNPALDLNSDNVTDLADLALLLAAFGGTCP